MRSNNSMRAQLTGCEEAAERAAARALLVRPTKWSCSPANGATMVWILERQMGLKYLVSLGSDRETTWVSEQLQTNLSIGAVRRTHTVAGATTWPLETRVLSRKERVWNRRGNCCVLVISAGFSPVRWQTRFIPCSSPESKTLGIFDSVALYAKWCSYYLLLFERRWSWQHRERSPMLSSAIKILL